MVGALSGALSNLALEVRVILPCYGSMDTTGFEDLPFHVEIPLLGHDKMVTFLETRLDGVIYDFICHPWFSARKGIYGDTSFTPYADNLERFTLLNKAVMPLLKALDWKADVIHCHDWTCGFLPYLLGTSKDPFFKNTKSVMTIHNLAYQGEYPRLQLLGSDILPDERMFSGEVTKKQVNMLKTGLEFADYLTTVSPTYAHEIQSKEFGCNLDNLLQQRTNSLAGIINGIDYTEWNPQSDTFIDHHFEAADQRGKALVKAELQKEFGLEVRADLPLFSMISRLAEQKGFVELLEGEPCALQTMMETLPMQMVIVGTGDQRLEDKLKRLAHSLPNLSVNILFSNKAAHRLEAGSDFFLMPSRYEPCGLNQLYSLRYGTLPVARKTGGLADSILDLDQEDERGTGILFENMSGNGILEAVKRALAWWNKGIETIEQIRTRCMAWDSSWERSARSYLNIYENISRGN